MKKRRSLLFGLGILVALSVTTPAAAAIDEKTLVVVDAVDNTDGSLDGTSDADVAPGSGENAGSSENTDSAKNAGNGAEEQTEGDGEDASAPDAQAEAETVVYTWVQETVGQEVKWILQSVSGDTAAPVKAGFYIISDHTYWIGEEGVLLSGVAEVKNADSDGNNEAELAAGKYYFRSEGTDPQENGDGLGAMVISDWVKETADGVDSWYWAGEDGKIDASKTGWQEIDGKWYCLDEFGVIDTTKNDWQQIDANRWVYAQKGTGTIKSGWQSISGKWYYLDKQGRRDTNEIGWQQISGKWYYLKNDGARDTSKIGDQTINGSRYYLKSDGTLMTGFQKVGGQTYYYGKDGKRQNYTGWREIDGKLYYFNGFSQVANSGANGWVQTNGKWYWFESGNAASGWRYINNKWYYMDPTTKVMKTGLYSVGGTGYYSDASGAMRTGWVQHGGTWYYFHENGAMAKGWLLLGNTWYYLDPATGAMKTGLYSVGGTGYFSDASGAMRTGWILINGKTWYYFNGSGAMARGWLLLGNTWYYLDPATGAMKTGMYNVGGLTYYSTGSGAMATGWVLYKNNWYYFNGSGAMVRGWILLGKTWYYLDPSSGVMKTGLYDVGGATYYSDASGAMRTGWILLYGTNWYYFNGSGAMVKNTWVDGYWVDKNGVWIPGYRSPSIAAATVDGGTWIRSGSTWNYVDKSGNKVTGWKYISGYKYYFDSNGNLIQDVENIIGKQSSYKVTINRVKCQIMVYAKDETGNYCIPVKTFVCSVGLPGTPTPTGTFQIPMKAGTAANSGLVTLMGPSWGKWGTLITYYRGIYFHSVACSSTNPTYSLPSAQYNLLGYPASHGCVRLCVRDAKWIWMNCPIGTTVEVSDTAYCPFDKPAAIRIPAGQNWDPTDPDVNR